MDRCYQGIYCWVEIISKRKNTNLHSITSKPKTTKIAGAPEMKKNTGYSGTCDFCGTKEHIARNCFWSPNSPNRRLPEKSKTALKVIVVKKSEKNDKKLHLADLCTCLKRGQAVPLKIIFCNFTVLTPHLLNHKMTSAVSTQHEFA